MLGEVTSLTELATSDSSGLDNPSCRGLAEDTAEVDCVVVGMAKLLTIRSRVLKQSCSCSCKLRSDAILGVARRRRAGDSRKLQSAIYVYVYITQLTHAKLPATGAKPTVITIVEHAHSLSMRNFDAY